MNIELDTHTHTLASGHAYNTIREMIEAAAAKGLKLLALTEHAPAMPGSCGDYYFYNLKILPRFQKGIEVMFGVELNVMDYEGHVDLPQHYIQCTDLRIASLHPPCLRPGTKEENTAAMMGIIHNPYVNILGHPDDGRYAMDYEAVISEAKKYDKIVGMMIGFIKEAEAFTCKNGQPVDGSVKKEIVMSKMRTTCSNLGYKFNEATWSKLIDEYVEFTLRVNQREQDKIKLNTVADVQQ